MTYVPLVLGILLALAGCLSIISGYDIITIERGWTEVIAGTTAATGGVISICLWFVLRQIYHLRQAIIKAQIAVKSSFEAPLSTAATRIVATEENKAPAIAPLAAPFIADETAAPKVFPDIEEAAKPEADDRQKTFDFTQTPEEPVALEHAPSPTPDSRNYDVTEPTILQLSPLPVGRDVAPETVSHDTVDSLASEPPHSAEHELAEELTGPVEIYAAAESHHAEVVKNDKADDESEQKEEEPAPSLSALSLDEMWRRVSEEIDRPILPPKTATAERNWFEPRKPAAPAPEPGQIEEQPPIEEDVLARDDALERALEEELRMRSHEPVEEADHSPAEPAPEAYVEPERVETEAHAEPQTPRPPIEPPVIPPTVIGRYESDGTTYTMFSDGSIEAQSETGVYQFASMADLKAFIEARQAPAEV